MTAAALPPPVVCVRTEAIDGDNFRCFTADGRRINVRLLGIDTPEMPGKCRKGRVCVPGDPFAAKASLARALRFGPVSYRVAHYDYWRRPDAVVMAGTVNLSCWQLTRGGAFYKPKWDSGRRIARACGR